MLFFFHQRTLGGLIEDPDGTDLPDVDRAVAEALKFARYLWADAIIRQDDLTGECFEIADRAGRRVASVPLVEIEPHRVPSADQEDAPMSRLYSRSGWP